MIKKIDIKFFFLSSLNIKRCLCFWLVLYILFKDGPKPNKREEGYGRLITSKNFKSLYNEWIHHKFNFEHPLLGTGCIRPQMQRNMGQG